MRAILALSVVLLALPGVAQAAAPDLTVSVADSPDPVSAGGNVTYDITVTNQGDGGSGAVTVTDALPTGLTRVSFGGPTCGSPSGNSVTCAPLAPGASAQLQLVAKVDDNAAPLTTYDNTVSVTPGSHTDTERTTVGVADLALAMNDDLDPIAPGRDLRYTLTLSNPGTSVARSVSLQAALPARTTFVAAGAPGGWTTTAPPSGGTGSVTFAASSVPAGASAQFTIDVHVSPTAPDGATLSSSATVSTTTPELTTQNNSATETTGVSTKADLATAIVASPDPVAPGGKLVYDVTLANSGAVDARDVALTDTLGPGLDLVSVEQTAGPAFSCGDDSSCSIANLPSRTSAHFAVAARTQLTTAGMTVFNTAAATTSTPETSSANNSATAAVTVARIGPDLGFRFSTRPRVVKKGKTSLVTFKVVNRGNAPATGVTFTETLSRRLGYVRAKASRASCRSRRPRVICALRTIKPGATKTVKLTVLAARRGRVKIKAAAISREPDLNPANNAATARMRIRR